MEEVNIFGQVKEKLRNIGGNKAIVADILGEPASSGTDNKYHSPFYSGDNDPSFIVNDNYISDFSAHSDFGTGKDIYNFIVAYNDISHFISDKSIKDIDALKWIVDRYKLDVNISITNISNLPRPYAEKRKGYTLEPTSSEPLLIFSMFDNQQFTEKPTGEEIGQIKNRISSLKSTFLPYSEILSNLENGQTCIPAGIKSEKDWVEDDCCQQMFLVDIDNTAKINGLKAEYHVGDDKHITVEKILDYCKVINLIPTFIYYTLSHSEEQHRFRLVYVVDMPIQNKDIIKRLYKYLVSKFNNFNVDKAPTSVASLFLGGKKIAYNSKTFYTLRETEETITNFDALDVYNDILKYTPYAIYNKKLCHKKPITQSQKNKGVSGNYSYVEISNFITYVDKKITYDNGNYTSIYYQVNCIILDNPYVTLKHQIIEADKYAKGNYVLGSIWDKYAIIRSGRGNADRIREVTQIFSRKTMKEETVYTHTGFRKIDGKLCYLSHDNVIGDIKNVTVDLSRDNLQRYSFKKVNATASIEEIKEAINLSLSILDLADYSITVPLISVIYLAPLYSLLAKNDKLVDFVVFLQGASGSRKSSLTAVLLSHFGKFNRDTFPCTFRDTLNAIEKKAYILKDVPNVIDDYNPEIFGNNKLFIVEKLFGMYGDRVGRERMSSDGDSLKKSYSARGLCIMTGETIPEVAQSRIARSLIIDIDKDSIDLTKLSHLQDNLELLSLAMKEYIQLIINSENSIENELNEKYNELTQSSINVTHGRTAEIAVMLKLGFYVFSQFLASYKILTDNDCNELIAKGYETIDTISIQQSSLIDDLNPVEMFFNAIEELISNKTIYIDDILDTRFQSLTMPPLNSKSELVGYLDASKGCYYFFPNSIYSSITNHYKSINQKFPLSQKALWQYLEKSGYLYRTDKKRYTVQRKIYGSQKTVIEIHPPTERLRNIRLL